MTQSPHDPRPGATACPDPGAAPPHEHARGVRGILRAVFAPHEHDPADAINDARAANRAGIRAVKVSLVLLLAITAAQAIVIAFTGSVALIADTLHSLADALTAIPLWIAFVLARRRPTRTHTYGLGRAEDLGGIVIVLAIAASAALAIWQAIDRIAHPQPVQNLALVIAAGGIGFVGNELIATYRIRVGRRIGSASLVADGVHARTDGFTSLAVVAGGIGVAAGFPLADPIVGLLIGTMLVVMLIGTARSVIRRLLDGVDADLVSRAEIALSHVEGIERVGHVRLRWVGHRLHGEACITAEAASLAEAEQVRANVVAEAREHLPHLDEFTVEVHPPTHGGPAPHSRAAAL